MAVIWSLNMDLYGGIIPFAITPEANMVISDTHAEPIIPNLGIKIRFKPTLSMQPIRFLKTAHFCFFSNIINWPLVSESAFPTVFHAIIESTGTAKI